MQSVPVPVPLRSTMITTKKWKQTLFQSVRSNCNAVLTRASSLSSVSTPNTLTIDRFLRRSSLQTISHSIESANSINEFEILCILGSGTFGTVKLARHRPTNHPVAIKCLSKEDVVEMRQEMNLLREQHIHLSLCHPCISRMYTTFQDPTTVYFVLEYIPGGELYRVIYTTNNTDKQHDEIEPQQEDSTDSESDDEIREEKKRLLERQRSSSSLNHQATHLLRSGWFYGGLHPSHVAFYLGCLVSAMDYLHTQSIVYRDLKLENIVLDAMGYPKLIDFGLSKIVQTNIEICTTICGSMEYMAPEVLKRQGYTIKADLWSFGILMYELLFGTTPFHDTNTQEQTKRILEEEIIISTVFRKEYAEASNLLKLLLAKNPHDRPNSFHSLRTHAFFKEYFPSIKAWKQLETRKIQAPFIPVLENAFDTSLFPHACLEEEDEEEEEEEEEE